MFLGWFLFGPRHLPNLFRSQVCHPGCFGWYPRVSYVRPRSAFEAIMFIRVLSWLSSCSCLARLVVCGSLRSGSFDCRHLSSASRLALPYWWQGFCRILAPAPIGHGTPPTSCTSLAFRVGGDPSALDLRILVCWVLARFGIEPRFLVFPLVWVCWVVVARQGNTSLIGPLWLFVH